MARDNPTFRLSLLKPPDGPADDGAASGTGDSTNEAVSRSACEPSPAASLRLSASDSTSLSGGRCGLLEPTRRDLIEGRRLGYGTDGFLHFMTACVEAVRATR